MCSYEEKCKIFDNMINYSYKYFVFDFIIYGDHITTVEAKSFMDEMSSLYYELTHIINIASYLFNIPPQLLLKEITPFTVILNYVKNNLVDLDGEVFVNNIKQIQDRIVKYNYVYITRIHSLTKQYFEEV